MSSSEPVPNIEFVIHTGDTGKGGIGAPWVLGRREQEHDLTLMPDYGFYSWPEPGVGTFEEVQDKCQQFESKLSWKDKIPKLFWRGALMVNIRKVRLASLSLFCSHVLKGVTSQTTRRSLSTSPPDTPGTPCATSSGAGSRTATS